MIADNFILGAAFQPDGQPRANVSRKTRGIFDIAIAGHPAFSMLTLGDCEVMRAYLGRGIAGFEPFSLVLWASLAARPGIVLDIGAYTGIYSLLTAVVSPGTTVLAFEPNPTTFGRLLTNIRLNQCEGRISPVNKAVSDRSGHLDLALQGDIYTMSSCESLEASSLASAWGRKRVETIAADEIVLGWQHFHPFALTLELPAAPVSLVKIDVEGHEKATLEGMKRIIARDQPYMLVEVLNAGDLPHLVSSLDAYEALWVGEKDRTLSKEKRSTGANVLFFHESKRPSVEALAAGLGIGPT